MRIRLGIALAIGLAGSVGAETAADCAVLVGAVEGLTGLSLSAPPSGTDAGWCVLDGARLTGDGAPRITLQRLRIMGEVEGEELRSLEIAGEGLRIAPMLNDDEMPAWLRDLLRLQTADLRLELLHDAAAGRLVLRDGHLGLSQGSELTLMAEIAGGGLSVPSILSGRLTSLHLEWKNDGRTLRPVLEALGQRLEPGATGLAALDAARTGAQGVVRAMPTGSLAAGAAEALDRLVGALPQGRGRLVLDFASEAGIGAAQLGLLALAENPASPEALARLFAGSRISADWAPGLAP